MVEQIKWTGQRTRKCTFFVLFFFCIQENVWMQYQGNCIRKSSKYRWIHRKKYTLTKQVQCSVCFFYFSIYVESFTPNISVSVSKITIFFFGLFFYTLLHRDMDGECSVGMTCKTFEWIQISNEKWLRSFWRKCVLHMLEGERSSQRKRKRKKERKEVGANRERRKTEEEWERKVTTRRIIFSIWFRFMYSRLYMRYCFVKITSLRIF